LSDTGSESVGSAAAALLLAGFDRLASTRRIELSRGVLAVALLASRAIRDERPVVVMLVTVGGFRLPPHHPRESAIR
jgi:hypothetical protein